MNMPNSGMTIHTLVLIVDRFSCNCNSIQSPVSIVHLRVILTYLIPLLRVYINQHSSNAHSVQFRVQYSAVQFQLVQQCIQISTRINSSMYIVHTSFVSLETTFYIACIQQGFVDPKCNSYIYKKAKVSSILSVQIILFSRSFWQKFCKLIG